jgi:hypothetical protein
MCSIAFAANITLPAFFSKVISIMQENVELLPQSDVMRD